MEDLFSFNQSHSIGIVPSHSYSLRPDRYDGLSSVGCYSLHDCVSFHRMISKGGISNLTLSSISLTDVALECFEKARHEKPLLPLLGTVHPCSGSQTARHLRQDEIKQTTVNSVRGFGLPSGFSLIYNETTTAFRNRWSVAQGNILRNWIVPRYKPSPLPVAAVGDSHAHSTLLPMRFQNIPGSVTANGISNFPNQKTVPSQAFGNTVRRYQWHNGRLGNQESSASSSQQRPTPFGVKPFEMSLRSYAKVNNTVGSIKMNNNHINNPSGITTKPSNESQGTEAVRHTHPGFDFIFVPPPQGYKSQVHSHIVSQRESSGSSLEFGQTPESPVGVLEEDKLLTLIIDSEEDKGSGSHQSSSCSSKRVCLPHPVKRSALLNRPREEIPMARIQLVTKTSRRCFRQFYTPRTTDFSPGSSEESRLIVNPFTGRIVQKDGRLFPAIRSNKSNEDSLITGQIRSPKDRGS